MNARGDFQEQHFVEDHISRRNERERSHPQPIQPERGVS